MTFIRAAVLVASVALAAACGKSDPKEESAAPPPPPPPQDAALAVDAAEVAPDAAEPEPDAAVAAGKELWQDPDDDALVNPLEWNGVTLELVVTERTDEVIRGKLTATHDAMTMDVATWEIDANLGHWVHVAQKGNAAALRYGWAMDMATRPAGPGAENFVELVYDKKQHTVVGKRTWSGTRLDTPPAWAKGYIKVI